MTTDASTHTAGLPTPGAWLPVAGLALLLGLLGDALFNGAAPGLNFPLWLGALIGAFLLVARRNARPVGTLAALLLIASFGLSIMVAWRSAPELQLLLIAGSLGLLLLAFIAQDDLRVRGVSITRFVGSILVASFTTVQGIALLPASVSSPIWLSRTHSPRARAVARAALIATPLLLLFGALFFAADAVFETWVKDLLILDLSSVADHLAWSLGGTALAAGLLWSGLSPRHAVPSGPRLADERRLSSTELAIVLGSLASLFALFVVIQIHYLFGGEDHVQASTGLTYAQYARRGFFELVAVAALLLPVLLAADWARARNWRSLTTFRLLAALLVLLLVVIITSAFQRLRIYVDAYGLTALRLYVAASLIWLAAVFAWLLWSLLGQRRDQFVLGAVPAALVALVLLVAINPHATIAATNLARADDGHDFDTPYALTLSADATPTLVDGLATLPPPDACQIARTLLQRWDTPDQQFRSWNWSRTAARAAVDSNRDTLQSACD